MPTLNRQISTLPYLETPHSHNPAAIPQFIGLPSSMLLKLPMSIHEIVWTLQESTSVVFASYNRLQELLNERENRSFIYNSVTGQVECEKTSYIPHQIETDY